MQVGVLQGSKFYKFAIRETSYCIVTFSLSYETEKLINAERADNKIKNTETLLGCIKYSMWLNWIEGWKIVLVLDKRKTHAQTLNDNHMFILNRRQIPHCYIQSWLNGKKTEVSCKKKSHFSQFAFQK